jgi:hypothetical protein
VGQREDDVREIMLLLHFAIAECKAALLESGNYTTLYNHIVLTEEAYRYMLSLNKKE